MNIIQRLSRSDGLETTTLNCSNLVGYRKWNSPGDRTAPSWRQFAAEHRAGYEPNAAALALIEARPKIQIGGDDGVLDFVDEQLPAKVAPLDLVITYVQTVRNNLFHGGKHCGHDWDDPDRMKLLLVSTIGVLDDLAERAGFCGDYTGYY